jgi:E3 ubiquitin-protein ligase HUWE1
MLFFELVFGLTCKPVSQGRLHVTFQGEEGVDAGGLSREWFLTLSKQMLNPDKALFLPSVNGLTFQPNPASGIQPDHIG